MTPLTLTLLSAAVPASRRGLALGAWGGIGGLAVALGPLVGGAVVSGISWQWIFWLNVPIGLLLSRSRGGAWRRATARAQARPARARPRQRRPARDRLGLVRGNSVGWGSPRSSLRSPPARVLVALFVLWELRTEAPMLPMRFFRNRTFA